jgi:hypothetical protein
LFISIEGKEKIAYPMSRTPSLTIIRVHYDSKKCGQYKYIENNNQDAVARL